MGCYCNVGVHYDYNCNLYAAAVVKARVSHFSDISILPNLSGKGHILNKIHHMTHKTNNTHDMSDSKTEICLKKK